MDVLMSATTEMAGTQTAGTAIKTITAPKTARNTMMVRVIESTEVSESEL
jgi:hypothetical protein